MAPKEDMVKMLATHPCYCEDAHKKYARMHLPVAPRCNIQCNYCNRKYDCSNESRPGVTSEVLSPSEAVEKIREVKAKIPELKVIGIAGPGDPLANEETFETFELVKREFPDLTLCVSTNGLMLPKYAERLYGMGIRFLTVTMNAVDPAVSRGIYGSVVFDGKKYKGLEGARILLDNQLEGIRKCVELGIAVKINIVMIPGINDSHIPEMVKKVKSMGVYIVNILPLIPVEGTVFSDRRSPTPEERKRLMDLCSTDVRMMRHCRQCRADAIGLLDRDRSSEFVRQRPCGCERNESVPENKDIIPVEQRIAVASTDGRKVDCGFGNAPVFRIYASDGNIHRFLQEIRVDTSVSVSGGDHAKHLSGIIDSLNGCTTIIVREIGPRPEEMLRSRGKTVFVSKEDVDAAITASLRHN